MKLDRIECKCRNRSAETEIVVCFIKKEIISKEKSNLMEVQEVKESNFFYPCGWGSSCISVCLMSIYIHSFMLICLSTKCMSYILPPQNDFFRQKFFITRQWIAAGNKYGCDPTSSINPSRNVFSFNLYP